jgi:hypothetical protein
MLRTSLCLVVGAALTTTLEAQGCFNLNVGTSLNLTDDSNSAALPLGFTFTFNGVGYTDIVVCSNGYIWFGPTGAVADYTASIAELTTGAPRLCPAWGDWNPSAVGSGNVYFNTAPGTATITWAGVYEFGHTTPIDMQVVLDAASGIRITYGANPMVGGTFGGGTPILIGASPGGAAVANPVVFAPRPMSVGVNTFHEFLAFPPAFAYTGVSMQWSSTAPGYGISTVICTPNTLPPPAKYEVVGAGCPPLQTISVYETFANNGNLLDLANTNFLLTPNGLGGYLVLPSLGGSFYSTSSTTLPAGDDSTHLVPLPFAFPHATGPYSSIYVSSNGFLTLGTVDPFSGCCAGSPAALLSGPPRVAGFWQDLYPPGGGQVFAELDAVNNEFVVTWNNVPEYPTTAPVNTFQIALDPAGNIKIRLQTIQITSATRVALVGYSDGNGASDPGITNLSAIPGVLDLGARQTPLSIAAAAGDVPNLGATFTTNVSGIAASPNGNIVLLLLSTEIPPFNLAVINMPGCNAYLALPEFASFLNFTFGAPTTTFSIFVPLDPALGGQQIMSQAVSDDLNANPFGWRASNGGRWTIGL